MRRSRGPWSAAAALAAVAGLLFLFRVKPAAPASAPPPPPPPVEPARFEVVAGVLEGPRVARRAVLAFPEALEVVLHEESLFRAERADSETVFHLEAGRIFLDGGDVRIVTPQGFAAARASALDVAIDERGTSVTVLHGAALVVGTPFRKEIVRGEALDLRPGGALGEPLSLDPTAAVEWARDALDAASLVRDGGFEQEFTRWDAPRYEEADVRPDRRGHTGRRSALVAFNAVRDYRHASPRSTPFDVPPGARLRFRGYVEVSNLEAGPGGGGFLEIRDENGVPLPGARSPLFAGAAGWRKFSLEVAVPDGLRGARVVVSKADNGAPILGTLRVDDVAVLPLSP